ncbi:MAG: ferredoxin [Pseudomonadota bacterium]
MPKLIVTNRKGETSEIEAEDGLTVMEAIRDNGIDELLALCGGCCSCATCQIYVDDTAGGELAAMSEDEDDLLESSDHRKENSRLACQVPFTADLDGMKITISPED